MKENLKLVCFVVILGTVLSGIVIIVNSLTADLIEKNVELTMKRNVLEAHNIAYRENSLEEVFKQNIGSVNKGNKTFYLLKNNDIAFEFNGPGLWGPISGVISLFSDLKTIKKIKIIHQEETPGLGSRLAENEYLKNFENKRIYPRLEILNRRKAERENEVDGITGATMTSKAFEGLINEEVKRFLAVYGVK